MNYVSKSFNACLLYAAVALCVPVAALAQETLPSAACQEAEKPLEELQLKSRELDAHIAGLEAFSAGESRDAIGVAELEQLFDSDAEQAFAPADIRCASRPDEYEAAIAKMAGQRDELTARACVLDVDHEKQFLSDITQRTSKLFIQAGIARPERG